MIPSSNKVVQLSLAAFTSLPAVIALGCYSSGPTWWQITEFEDHNGYYNTAWEICKGPAGGSNFWPGSEKSGCLPGTFRRHVDWKIKYNGKQQGVRFDINDCMNYVQIEMHGCEHGSEQNHGDWWLYLDPNDGKDW